MTVATIDAKPIYAIFASMQSPKPESPTPHVLLAQSIE